MLGNLKERLSVASECATVAIVNKNKYIFLSILYIQYKCLLLFWLYFHYTIKNAFNPFEVFQTWLADYLLEKPLATSVNQMYADMWEAQTDGVDQQKCCIFQDPVDLSGQETKRSFSGSDCCFTSTLQYLSICLLSVSTSSSVTHLWTVIQTFIQKYWQKVKTQFLFSFSFFSYSTKSHCVIKVTIFHLCKALIGQFDSYHLPRAV